MRLAIVIVLALAAAAAADPCPSCTRGDALIDHFQLQSLRALDLASITLGDPVTADQYARLVELRRGTPAAARLGAIDDADLALIAAALCHVEAGACVDATTHALRCLGDRCAVALPPDPIDLPTISTSCQLRSRSPSFGLGLDVGTGWQRSRYPTDGHAGSIGVEGRVRFGARLGAVARVDRTSGRDASEDADGDGKDDVWTGSITRISALAGPSLVFDRMRFPDTTRYLRLDLLGGYVATRSQPNESGPAAGADLTFQLWALRIGARFVQGFGDARDATMLLAHVGFLTGAAPIDRDASGCEREAPESSSRLGLGLEVPLGGYGFSKELGYLATGVAVEALWHANHVFDLVTRGDLLLFPGGDRERVIDQALLAGVRVDLSTHQHGMRSGIFTTLMGGYMQAAGVTPTTTGSGPIADAAFAYGIEGSDGAAYLRVHYRLGVSSANRDYHAVFVSMGFELRLDPSKWGDRD